MQRIRLPERAEWRAEAEALGFRFHTIDGEPYWVDDGAWTFTLRQVEDDIEAASAELHALAMDLVAEAVRSESMMARLGIPEAYRDWIAQSWARGDRHLYGRMDLAYTGHGPAKLLEFNYDTPTSLYESAYFQWLWLEARIARSELPAGADQYNAIQDRLIEAFGLLQGGLRQPLYLSSVRDHVEDRGTVLYVRDCAVHAGIDCRILDLEDIGLSVDGRFTDTDDYVIESLFKLYPWEDMFADRYGSALPGSGLIAFEPPWKALLSNKAVLPLLWERHPGHPNLLEAHLDDGSALPPGWVRKPIHSREGANVELVLPDGSAAAEPGPYAGPAIRQAYAPLAAVELDGEGFHAVIGAWVIGDTPAGMGIREDRGLITRDRARFVPHVILD
ncbi:MAG: glutathionylspermidine synthase family protein [Xanthomonadales bacterium]|nr:glutathionylspermidine synthase family protein [Xanthomonadales bacterium]